MSGTGVTVELLVEYAFITVALVFFVTQPVPIEERARDGVPRLVSYL